MVEGRGGEGGKKQLLEAPSKLMLKNVTTMYIISVVDFFCSSFKQSIDKLQEKTQSKSPSRKKEKNLSSYY